jgi:hypothetical protein
MLLYARHFQAAVKELLVDMGICLHCHDGNLET